MAKELTKEEKRIKAKSTGQVLEDFYISQVDKKGKNKEQIKSAALDLYLKSITDNDAAKDEMKRLQDEADAEDAVFNADLAAQREQRNTPLTTKESSKRKPPANYLTQEQVQAQNAIDEKQGNMVPIKEPEYTSAGKVGKGIREGIGSALNYAGDVTSEYFTEPLLNLPGSVGNISNAAMEGVAGVAGYPLNLGRYEKLNMPTRFDKKEPYPAESPEKPQPLSEPEPTPEAAPAPKEALKKAYAVVFSGKKADQNKTFDTMEDAKSYYAKQGGTKGGIITLSPQEKETAQEQSERIAYGQTNKQAEDRTALKQKLTETGKQAWAEAKKARDAENAANRAKFEKFKSGVSERDDALVAYNQFNKSQGLLNKAYNKALSKGDYLAADAINTRIEEESRNVPTEMGARQQYVRERVPINRQAAIEAEAQRKKDIADELERQKSFRLLNEKYNQSRSASNPDSSSNQYSYNSGFNLLNSNYGSF